MAEFGDVWDLDDDQHELIGSEFKLETNEHNKTQTSLYNEGYRTSKASTEERLMQEGFDHGFAKGLTIGRVMGELYVIFKLHERRAVAAQAKLLTENGHTVSDARRALAQFETIIFTDLQDICDEEGVYDIKPIVESIRHIALLISADFADEISVVLSRLL